MSIFSSTGKSLVFLQILSIVLIIVGVIFYPINFNMWYFLLSLIMFYCYTVLGISMMLHRYYTHKSFQLNTYLKWFFTMVAVLAGRGSPIGWTYIHRMHHRHSDTDMDPHSPHFSTFKFVGFRPVQDPNKKINHFIIKDLMTPMQLKLDKYYLLAIFLFLAVLWLINFNLVFYVWALPVFVVSITQTMFNYFAHKYGYRNFETNDHSTNNIYLWPLIMGDAWHNNHHYNAKSFSTKVKKYEFDPVSVVINLISKNENT